VTSGEEVTGYAETLGLPASASLARGSGVVGVATWGNTPVLAAEPLACSFGAGSLVSFEENGFVGTTVQALKLRAMHAKIRVSRVLFNMV
jgi:hypothetical protein